MSGGVTVLVTPQPQARIVVTEHRVRVVEAAEQGLAGPPGPPGATGPPGPPGPGVETFIFNQAAPAALWLIVHNLGTYPSVTVVDSTEREVIGDITYLDGNRLTVAFSAPFSGTAYLN